MNKLPTKSSFSYNPLHPPPPLSVIFSWWIHNMKGTVSALKVTMTQKRMHVSRKEKAKGFSSPSVTPPPPPIRNIQLMNSPYEGNCQCESYIDTEKDARIKKRKSERFFLSFSYPPPPPPPTRNIQLMNSPYEGNCQCESYNDTEKDARIKKRKSERFFLWKSQRRTIKC